MLGGCSFYGHLDYVDAKGVGYILTHLDNVGSQLGALSDKSGIYITNFLAMFFQQVSDMGKEL